MAFKYIRRGKVRVTGYDQDKNYKTIYNKVIEKRRHIPSESGEVTLTTLTRLLVDTLAVFVIALDVAEFIESGT